jgi:hypothetical protein
MTLKSRGYNTMYTLKRVVNYFLTSDKIYKTRSAIYSTA